MAMAPFILVANPGSASRKYALYDGEQAKVHLHFEYEEGRVVCTIDVDDNQEKIVTDLPNVTTAIERVMPLFEERNILPKDGVIKHIGVRIVAPTGFFLHDHIIDDDTLSQLEKIRAMAPLHIEAVLEELRLLRTSFPDTTVVGISDSAFHNTKPDYAWNYGLPLKDADRLDIKRFGYHGLSVAAAVRSLKEISKLPPKLIVCHLGSGASVTAVGHGKSRDTTMGYSPLEGVVMATRVGNIDPTALLVLKSSMGFDDLQLEHYLNEQSGLLGISGTSSDIRELLKREAEGDHLAELALKTYIFNIQKAIGQMAAVLDGADMLVFTGTVGERSAPIRERVMKTLHYLDFILDDETNQKCFNPRQPQCVSRLAHSRPIFVVPADEATEIARRSLAV